MNKAIYISHHISPQASRPALTPIQSPFKWYHGLYPRKQWRTQEFFRGGGSTNSVEDKGQTERGSGGGSPLVRGSGGSCNLVQEI